MDNVSGPLRMLAGIFKVVSDATLQEDTGYHNMYSIYGLSCLRSTLLACSQYRFIKVPFGFNQAGNIAWKAVGVQLRFKDFPKSKLSLISPASLRAFPNLVPIDKLQTPLGFDAQWQDKDDLILCYVMIRQLLSRSNFTGIKYYPLAINPNNNNWPGIVTKAKYLDHIFVPTFALSLQCTQPSSSS